MNIYNQTLYDKTLMIKYNQYFFRNFMLTRFSLMAAVVIAFSIYLAIMVKWTYVWYLLGILGSYGLLMFLFQNVTLRKHLKTSPIVENPVMQEYLFTEDGFVSIGEKIPYSDLTRITISKQFFLLTSSKKRTYIVLRSGFQSAEDDAVMLQKFQQLISKKSKRTK